MTPPPAPAPAPTDLTAVLEAIKLAELVELRRRYHPGEWYLPHERGQRQFHESRHTIRGLFPGNGWGKTIAMASEVNAWVTHTNRWQLTPAWPVICLWFCQEFRQFDMLRPQLEELALTRTWRWDEQKHRYTWPDGSQLYIASCDRSWTYLQGINPDLILFDEEPPVGLWREMQMRRRGKRDTRYVIAATATQGITWMYEDLYKPWLKVHAEAGLNEERAMAAQTHPDMWLWTTGGIDDNPGASQEQRRWYHTRTWSSPKEKKVRLHGGFESWVGDPIFDEDALARMRVMLEAAEKEYGGGRLGVFVIDDAPAKRRRPTRP